MLQAQAQAFPGGWQRGVLVHSGIEAASAAFFLHENLLNFISDHALEDAAAAMQSLCDTGMSQCWHIASLEARRAR